MTRSIVLVLVLMSVVGCSAAPAGPGATTPASVAATGPTATTPAAATSATASPTAAAIDVATVLPKTAGGLPLETTVVSGSQVDSVFEGGLKAIATKLGVDVSTMKVAIGFGGQSQGEPIATVIQVPGQDTASLKDAVKFGVSPVAMAAGIQGKPATVGGKDVQTFTGTFGGATITTYIYVVGDTIFVIRSSPDVAEELLAGLP